MTRKVLSLATAIALLASLTIGQSRAIAQEQESADASADAQVESNQSNGEASGDAHSDAAQTEVDAQAQTSSESDVTNSSDNQSTLSGEASTRENSRQTTRDRSSRDGSVPQPSRQNDENAQYDRNRDADANANRARSQRDVRRDRDRDRDDDYRNNADAARRDRSDANRRERDDRHYDTRRGIRFGDATDRGLRVHEIERNSFYFDVGLRRGDVIVSLHGHPVLDDRAFYRYSSQYRGERVPVVVLRDGRRETIYIEYPQEVAYVERGDNRRAYLGVIFDDQVRDGAIIRRVTPGSPADEAGLERDDEILAVNGKEVRSYRDVISTVHSMRPGEELVMIVARGREEAELEAVLAAQPAGPARSARTAESEVYVEERGVVAPAEGEFERDDRRILDRDRDEDGQRDRGLLRRVLD